MDQSYSALTERLIKDGLTPPKPETWRADSEFVPLLPDRGETLAWQIAGQTYLLCEVDGSTFERVRKNTEGLKGTPVIFWKPKNGTGCMIWPAPMRALHMFVTRTPR